MSTFGDLAAEGSKLTFGSAAAASTTGDGMPAFSGFGAPATGDAPAAGGFGASFGAAAGFATTPFGESATTTEPKEEGEEEGEEGAAASPEVESTAEFTPVVQLEEVDVKTHEEEEEVVYKMRSRLFRFTETLLNKGSGKKEWIERGVGEMKLLKHRESGKMRVLMRQEKTMKVIANHVTDPRIDLQPNVGSDRSWVWSVFDFSEGDLVEEIFAIRFGNADNATAFKDEFTKAQAVMKTLLEGGDAEPDAGADEAAEALSSLKATDDKPAAVVEEEEAPKA